VKCASEEEAEPVVVVVGESVPDSPDLLDEEVDGFGGPVGPSCVVVGEDFRPPAGDGAAEAAQSATSPFLAPKAADAEPVAGLGHVP